MMILEMIDKIQLNEIIIIVSVVSEMDEIKKEKRKEKEEDVIWRGKGQGAGGLVRDLCWDRSTKIIHCDRAKGNKM